MTESGVLVQNWRLFTASFGHRHSAFVKQEQKDILGFPCEKYIARLFEPTLKKDENAEGIRPMNVEKDISRSTLSHSSRTDIKLLPPRRQYTLNL
jgi:hypothetical protein